MSKRHTTIHANSTPKKSADNVTSFPLSATAQEQFQAPALTHGASAPSHPQTDSKVPANIDPILESKLESLKRKQRADAFLNTINADQTIQIMYWVEELESLAEVHRRVHAPPPD